MPPVEEPPTLSEIGRRLSEVKADVMGELRALRHDVVRADVYTAHRATDDLRLKVIEEELRQMADDRRAMRRLVVASVLAAVGSVVAAITTAIIVAVIGSP